MVASRKSEQVLSNWAERLLVLVPSSCCSLPSATSQPEFTVTFTASDSGCATCTACVAQTRTACVLQMSCCGVICAEWR
jgi:hypothetical protein